jgi:hypothetical protein
MHRSINSGCWRSDAPLYEICAQEARNVRVTQRWFNENVARAEAGEISNMSASELARRAAR